MNKHEIKGKIKEVKGKVKKVTGRIVGDKIMEVEGNIEETLGKAQGGYGDLKKNSQAGIEKDE